MRNHNFEITDNHIVNVGNMLVVLRKSSAIGVTEMDILKHMYQNKIPGTTIDKQAGLSSALLELGE